MIIRGAGYIALLAAMLSSVALLAQSPPPLAVELKATAPISTANCAAGQVVLFSTVTAFVADGESFPAGSVASGEITQCKGPGVFGHGGLLVVKMRGVQLASGQTLPLHGTAVFKGGAHLLEMAGGAVAAGLIVTPYVAPAALLVHGGAAVMPAGAVVVATVGGGDQKPPAEKTKPAPKPTAQGK